jgi:hypothetical protein
VLRVAFATPGVLPILRGEEGTVYGGSELRAWRFARGLADAGFEVSIVGGAASAMSPDLLGPVSVVTTKPAQPLQAMLRRIVRTQRTDHHDLWRRAGADVYVAFGAAEYNAGLGEWCERNGRPFVLFAGSDADFSQDYRPGNTDLNTWGSRCDRCYDSIRLATRLVVQGRKQKQLARDRFGLDATIIANPVVMRNEPDDTIGSRFLWIGKAVANKRPELALALAEACPDQQFTMILNDIGNGLFERISGARPANVEIVASVPPAHLGRYFAQARALICTSDFEGFPNTFLDAGSFGVPVLSLRVDPDGIVAREQGGFVTHGDLAGLASAVEHFAAAPHAAIAAGRRLYDYVRREHEASRRVDELAGLLKGLTFAAPLAARDAV